MFTAFWLDFKILLNKSPLIQSHLAITIAFECMEDISGFFRGLSFLIEELFNGQGLDLQAEWVSLAHRIPSVNHKSICSFSD